MSPANLGTMMKDRSTYLTYRTATGPLNVPVTFMCVGLCQGGNIKEGCVMQGAAQSVAKCEFRCMCLGLFAKCSLFYAGLYLHWIPYEWQRMVSVLAQVGKLKEGAALSLEVERLMGRIHSRPEGEF